MASINQSMPWLLDRELSSITADAFGHRHFAKALENLIESPTLEPPYSIGLLGKWGTGKSTIKELYPYRSLKFGGKSQTLNLSQFVGDQNGPSI